MGRIFIFLSIMLLSLNVNATWMIEIEDNLFTGGNDAMLMGKVGDGHLIVECQSSLLFLSFVEEETPDDEEYPASILIKLDNNKVIRSEAIFKKRNEEYTDVVTENREFIFQFLRELSSAVNKITVGIDLNMGDSGKFNYSGDVIYAKEKTKEFIEACQIEL